MNELVTVFTIIFVLASALIFIFDRFSHPVIPAYILTGLIVGNIIPEEEFLILSQIGIVFLIFIFGLKTDLNRIKPYLRDGTTATAVQLVFIGTLLYLIGSGVGLDKINSLYLALAGALSSSLIGIEFLEKDLSLDLLHGRLAESMQTLQDLVAIAFIVGLSTLSTNIELYLALASAIFLLFGGLVFRNTIFSKIARLASSEEMLMLIALTILTLFVGVGEILGLSMVLGAFTAGIAVSKFPENIEIMDSIGSLKDFFSAILFISLGALVSSPSYQTFLFSAILVVSIVVFKPLITILSLMVKGYDERTSYIVGINLDQISEFALIIAVQAHIAGSIEPAIFQSIILASAITMPLSSYTSRHQEKIYQLGSRISPVEVNSKKVQKHSQLPENMENHVILVGYDTQGREISEALEEENQEFVVIENDPEKITELSERNYKYLYGDVLDHETWKEADYEKAKLILSTAPITEVSRTILHLDTDADIVLRADEMSMARFLLEEGATYVESPDVIASEELKEHLRGVLNNANYREELRRKSMLEIRRQLGPTE